MKRWLPVVLLAVALGADARGQGCSQCREAVGQTPAATQRAYRRGIGVLLAAVACVCGATVVVIRQFR
jgi:hypothetical protein